MVLLVVPLEAIAQEEPAAYDVFILGGGKTREDAEKVAARIKERVYPLRWSSKVGGSRVDTVTVIESKEIAGLKPGLFIALAGMCRHEQHDSTSRKKLLAKLQKLEKGTYVRTVKGSHGDPCPSFWDSALSPDARELALRAAIDKSSKDTSALVAYGEYLADAARLHEADLFASAALEIDPKHEAAKNLAQKMMVLLTD